MENFVCVNNKTTRTIKKQHTYKESIKKVYIDAQPTGTRSLQN